MKLKVTVPSYLNPKNIYGNAGDPVKMIKDNGIVYLVEDENGNRFSVLKTEVTEDENVLIIAAEKQAVNKIQAKKTSKSIPTTQTLF